MANTKTDDRPIAMEPALTLDDGTPVDEVQKEFTVEAFLRDVPFPATKEFLLGYAQGKGCGPEIMSFIQSLPDNLVEYDNAAQLQKALQGGVIPEEKLDREPGQNNDPNNE